MRTTLRDTGRQQSGDGAAPVSFLVDLSLGCGGVYEASVRHHCVRVEKID